MGNAVFAQLSEVEKARKPAMALSCQTMDWDDGVFGLSALGDGSSMSVCLIRSHCVVLLGRWLGAFSVSYLSLVGG